MAPTKSLNGGAATLPVTDAPPERTAPVIVAEVDPGREILIASRASRRNRARGRRAAPRETAGWLRAVLSAGVSRASRPAAPP